MCGRFTLHTPPADWAAPLLPGLDLEQTFVWTPRYNIAPTQSVPVVRQLVGPLTDDGRFASTSIQLPNRTDVREIRPIRWGLLPPWAKELGIGASMINARSETAHEKPSFRKPLERRRCLIPADGYYEWQKVGKNKQPFYISRPDHRTLWMAGLWEVNSSLAGPSPTLLSCTLLTTAAQDAPAQVHDRMPVFVPPDWQEAWLSHEPHGRDILAAIQAASDQPALAVRPVSPYVNNARHEGPDCLAAPTVDPTN